jgi:ankyrin repeat protein
METTKLIGEHIVRELAALTSEYICPVGADVWEAATHGHHELFTAHPECPAKFAAACASGNMDFIKRMLPAHLKSVAHGITHAANQDVANFLLSLRVDWNECLMSACEDNHTEAANCAIAHGAKQWNRGLSVAARHGSDRLANFMMDNGADNHDDALHIACKHNHASVATAILKTSQATDTIVALDIACEHGALDAIKCLEQYDSYDWCRAGRVARKFNQTAVLEYLEERRQRKPPS